MVDPGTASMSSRRSGSVSLVRSPRLTVRLAGTVTFDFTADDPSPTSMRSVRESVVSLTIAATRLPVVPSSSATMSALRTCSGPAAAGTFTPSEAE
ncbi:hypothetical protein HR12_06655 [Microbacterium sp. SUBG005]|nr:hypothetical protein HR12_06655 [Microbacterium sp. SUBG005]